MATPSKPESTAFSKDILGRYVCNGLDEALRTTDTSIRFDARPFDIIIVGGGSFGAVAAQHLFSKDSTHSHKAPTQGHRTSSAGQDRGQRRPGPRFCLG